MCFVGKSLSTGVLVRYVSLRCLIQVDSGARPSSTSIYSDCSLSYVIKFPLNLKIPKLVVSCFPPTPLVQVCKQQHFLCAARLWMALSLMEWGRQKSVASETPINCCEEF